MSSRSWAPLELACVRHVVQLMRPQDKGFASFMIIEVFFVIFLQLIARTCSSVLDKGESFLLSASCAASVAKGLKFLASGSTNNGLHALREALLLCPSLGEAQKHLIEQGQVMRELGNESSAADLFEFVAKTTKNKSTEAVFQAGLSNANMGRVEVAGEWYRAVLATDPSHSSSRINLAALHHYFGSIDVALEQYKYGLYYLGPFRFRGDASSIRRGFLDAEMMLRANIGAAYIQLKMFNEARMHVANMIYDLLLVGMVCFQNDTESPIHSLSKLQRERFEIAGEFSPPPGATATPVTHEVQYPSMDSRCDKIEEDLSFAAAHLLNIRRATCDWQDREVLETFLLGSTLDAIGGKGSVVDFKRMVLLPFDSLLVPLLSLEKKWIIATAFAQGKMGVRSALRESSNTSSTVEIDIPKVPDTLRLGMLSYDFNDHPTAHLVEALFNDIALFSSTGEGPLTPVVELYVCTLMARMMIQYICTE